MPALKDSDLCWNHNPDTQREAQAARERGGAGRRSKLAATRVGLDELPGLEEADGIRRVLSIALADTLALDNSVKRNRALVAIASRALDLLKRCEDASGLEEIRDMLERAENSRQFGW